MSEIIINKYSKSITFINNGIVFSQFGVADEILDLINNLQIQLQQKENTIKEVREILNQDKASASFNTAERNALEILDKVD